MLRLWEQLQGSFPSLRTFMRQNRRSLDGDTKLPSAAGEAFAPFGAFFAMDLHLAHTLLHVVSTDVAAITRVCRGTEPLGPTTWQVGCSLLRGDAP